MAALAPAEYSVVADAVNGFEDGLLNIFSRCTWINYGDANPVSGELRAFFFANLKAWLEHGIDLRETDPKRAGAANV